MNIKLVNYGIANRIGDTIEINKAFFSRPRLFNKIIEHEKKHMQSKEQFKIEVQEPWDWEMFWFVLEHPSMWTQYLPVQIGRGQTSLFRITYDTFIITAWLLAGLLLFTFYWVMKWIQA